MRAQWGYVDVNNIAATATASGEEEERMAVEKPDRARPTGLALRRVDQQAAGAAWRLGTGCPRVGRWSGSLSRPRGET